MPDRNTSLYKFGSEILGYDLWQEESIPADNDDITRLRPFVGKAEEFGFHATLADALFFVTDSEVNRVKAELKTLCEDLTPFRLNEFRLSDNFREDNDLVLLCNDSSGITEVLHHELVSRVYNCAISSNYLSGRTHNKLPLSQRANLMIERYGAPYILKAFDLHFTLCSELPNDDSERRKLFDHAAKLFNTHGLGDDSVAVSEICLMMKRSTDKHWRIDGYYPLNKE